MGALKDTDYDLPQTQFSKGRARIAYACVDDLLNLLPKSKKLNAIGAANDLYLFIKAAHDAAPETAPATAERADGA